MVLAQCAPTPQPKLDRIWNVGILLHSLWPLLKQCHKHISLTHWNYFNYKSVIQIVDCWLYFTNISPKYYQNQGHILVIWIREITEILTPSPLISILKSILYKFFPFQNICCSSSVSICTSTAMYFLFKFLLFSGFQYL